jgi:hypothetical protein
MNGPLTAAQRQQASRARRANEGAMLIHVTLDPKATAKIRAVMARDSVDLSTAVNRVISRTRPAEL